MPSGCGCGGNSCGCQVTAGPGLIVSGTGNASAPYLIEVDSLPRAVSQVAAGTLDLSTMSQGAVAVVTLLGNVTNVTMPTTAGSFDVVFVQGAPGGFTVTFPATILFAGGTDPVVTATNGAKDWFRFVNMTSAWIGTRLAANVS
jgi:hypothetical protein